MSRRSTSSKSELNSYDWSKAERGKYVAKARESFETLVIDKETMRALSGPENILVILRALAAALPRRAKRKKAA